MLDMLQTRLSDIAAWHRIIPVPNDVLEEHKRAEVSKHPGSWWYHHEELMHVAPPLGFVSALVAAIISGVLSLTCLITGLFVAAAVFAMLVVVGALVCRKMVWLMHRITHIKGPARWQERQIHLLHLTAPDPIIETSCRTTTVTCG
jgi:hypothetical protein